MTETCTNLKLLLVLAFGMGLFLGMLIVYKVEVNTMNQAFDSLGYCYDKVQSSQKVINFLYENMPDGIVNVTRVESYPLNVNTYEDTHGEKHLNLTGVDHAYFFSGDSPNKAISGFVRHPVEVQKK